MFESVADSLHGAQGIVPRARVQIDRRLAETVDTHARAMVAGQSSRARAAPAAPSPARWRSTP